MALSLFLAQFFGLYFVITSAVLFLRKKEIPKFSEDIIKNRELSFVAGAMTTILGLFLVLIHNVWVNGWAIIITILSWATLIKGVALMTVPEKKFLKITKKIVTSKSIVTISFVLMVVGLYLSAIGFNL